MKEEFVHYLWRLQCFRNRDRLSTMEGDLISVKSPGTLHQNAGPDFSEARLFIKGIEWCGSIEIHLKASDWFVHGHHHDKAYDTVILHVVWEADTEVKRTNGSIIPCLQIKDYVQDEVALRYQHLFAKSPNPLPCAVEMATVNPLVRQNMLDLAMVERLEQKSAHFLETLYKNKNDWEETAYQLLMHNFGFKINQYPFSLLAKYLPYKILLKHSHSLFQTEALLFGMAGLLEGSFTGDYPKQLQKEFQFLKAKYFPEQATLAPHVWKMLRLRPSNFPCIRLAQVAAFIHQQQRFFQILLSKRPISDMKAFFDNPCSTYWQSHHHFDKVSKSNFSKLGKNSIELLILNTVPIIMHSYGKYHGIATLQYNAIHVLEELPKENNKVLRRLTEIGLSFKNAADTQGGLGLYKNYCLEKKCLECKIGATLLSPKHRLKEPVPPYLTL